MIMLYFCYNPFLVPRTKRKKIEKKRKINKYKKIKNIIKK